MSKSLDECTREELLEIIHNLKSRKKFGLVWEDKPEHVAIDCLSKIPVIQECPEREISQESGSEATHLIIEGDNYHALSILNYTHAKRIDVIYIDPPYNTGNKDFIYNDHFVDVEDGFRHSKWLSFMSKRLELAKGLLSDEGVIFISIDDNEHAHLRVLCDSIFSRQNFVTTIHCQMSTTQGLKVRAAQKGNVVKNGEYILCYAMNGRKNIARELLYDLRPEYDSHYNKYIQEGGQIVPLKEVYNFHFPADLPSQKALKLPEAYRRSDDFFDFVEREKANIVRGHTVTGFTDLDSIEQDRWTEVQRDGKPYLLSLDSKGSVYQLLRLSDSWGRTDGYKNEEGLRKIRGDWWEGFFTDMGNVSKEGGVPFKNGKKPVRLIKQLVKMASKKDSIVLDFFAGSGTTAQAVLEQNQEDGGSRQFILSTNNENNIADKATFPRVRNVIHGYGNREGVEANLRYFQTAFVEKASASDQTRMSLRRQTEDMIKVRENAFAVKGEGKEWRVLTGASAYTAIVFDSAAIEEAKEYIATLPTSSPINIYIFSMSSDSFKSDFLDLKHDVILCPIPESILEVYLRTAGKG